MINSQFNYELVACIYRESNNDHIIMLLSERVILYNKNYYAII